METVTTESEVIQNYSSCSSLLCENDSLCKTTVYLSGEQERAQAQCVCHGSFTGPRCEAVMKLMASDVTSRSIRISIKFNQTKTFTLPSEKILENYLMYSLNYWNNKTSQECSVIPQSSVRSHVISGLQPETEYTFCAKSDSFISWCPLEDLSNCLVIKTPNDLTSDSLPPYLVPVAIVVVVLIVVTVVSALIFRKKHFKCTKANESNYFGSQTFESHKRRKMKKDKNSQDLFLLSGTPPSERLQINTPPSPGRPKHSLTKHSSRGYASFSAKNDTAIALKTVLEYVPNENNDQTDPCLVIHDTSIA